MTENYYDALSDTSRIKTSLMSYFEGINDLTNLIMPQYDNNNFTFEENWYGGDVETNIYGNTESGKLVGHCFDTSYIEGAITDNRCAMFIETYVTKVANQRIKEVGVDVFVICHKDSMRLSEADKTYYESIGVYGNRVDSAIQVINASILNSNMMNTIREKYAIGNMNLSEENPLQQYVAGTDFYGKVLHYTYQAFYQRKNNVR